MSDDIIVTSFKFSLYKCPFSNSTEPTNFIAGANIQLHKTHIMIKVQVTLSKAEGKSEGQRSIKQKQKNGDIVKSNSIHRHHIW